MYETLIYELIASLQARAEAPEAVGVGCWSAIRIQMLHWGKMIGGGRGRRGRQHLLQGTDWVAFDTSENEAGVRCKFPGKKSCLTWFGPCTRDSSALLNACRYFWFFFHLAAVSIDLNSTTYEFPFSEWAAR